jgi:nucleoside-diphosphate-sugar epimerase
MITILGATGFVGRALVKELEKSEIPYFAPTREENIDGKNLGDVIYSIGLTADFRKRPFDTVEAHVGKLSEFLQKAQFDSFTYLSSTRVYLDNKERKVNENTLISTNIQDPNSIFNTSKLAGEALTLNCGQNKGKVIRLSNIYGDDFTSENFITSIIKEGIGQKKIVFKTTLDSAKDFISLPDAVHLILKIATDGKDKIYNVASGKRTTNIDIVSKIQQLRAWKIDVSPDAEKIVFPNVDISRVKKEFKFKPSSNLTKDLEKLIHAFERL